MMAEAEEEGLIESVSLWGSDIHTLRETSLALLLPKPTCAVVALCVTGYLRNKTLDKRAFTDSKQSL